MRAFIGVDFDSRIKKNILELQYELRKYTVKGRWKHSDNFHLTLKFLDEIDSQQQEKISDVMQKVCAGRNPFSLKISGLGTFGSSGSVRVLWLGLEGDMTELRSLQKDVENILVSVGFTKEKRSYSPHITLGQDIVFDRGLDEVKQIIGEVRSDFFEVDNIYLFKSEQVQNKRNYTKVEEYKFA